MPAHCWHWHGHFNWEVGRMKVYPIQEPLEAWQNDGGVMPPWVRRCTLIVDCEIVHERQCGRQIINRTDWLVRSLDGQINFYTNEEMGRKFNGMGK